ncbi:hypothetical protein FOL47_005137 [Perkinsus chesapeaki]|uniref:Nucleoprotein TPR n=1 Tax=Perkinsus chesapeaki TaxID=330153 RepID=A0A7J6LYV3_PERCH|nr:hypothetical protein FOL47_005137 [Perkinsus chesapeaki]
MSSSPPSSDIELSDDGSDAQQVTATAQVDQQASAAVPPEGKPVEEESNAEVEEISCEGSGHHDQSGEATSDVKSRDEADDEMEQRVEEIADQGTTLEHEHQEEGEEHDGLFQGGGEEEEEDAEMAMFDDLVEAYVEENEHHGEQEAEVAHVEEAADEPVQEDRESVEEDTKEATETSPSPASEVVERSDDFRTESPAEVSRLTRELMVLTRQLGELQSEKLSLQCQLSDANSRLRPLEFDNQSLQTETKRLGDKVGELWELVEHASTEKERTVTEMQKSRLDYNTQLSGMKSRLENAEAECRRLSKLHDGTERKLEDTVKDLASTRENADAEKSSLEGIISLKQQMVSNLEDQLKTQSGELAETKQELNNTLCSLSLARGKAESSEKEKASLLKERDELREEKEKYLREKIASGSPTNGTGRLQSITEVASEVLGREAPTGGFPLSALVDALMTARDDAISLRKANAHLEDLLDEVNAHVEAKAPEIEAIQRQNDELVVRLGDANEKIEIANAKLRETKDKLNSESHSRRQLESAVSTLRLQLQEQVNQTSVLLHEMELLKRGGGGGMKRRRSSAASSPMDVDGSSIVSLDGNAPSTQTAPTFMSVAELVSQNATLKASVSRLRNECETEAQKELAQLRADWDKIEEAYEELSKSRENDKTTYEGLLSRADKDKREMAEEIERLRKSLQDTAKAHGSGDAGAGGGSPSRSSPSSESKINLLQDKLETVKSESQKQLDMMRQECNTLREENRKLSTESIRAKTMLQLEKDRKSVISEAMGELRASLKRVEDDARATEKRSAGLAAQNATLEGTVKTVVHERSIALREKSEALEKMHSAQARVEVFSEQLQAVLAEKAKIASLLVSTQQRVAEETQSAREMAREQTEKVLHEMEELKNNLVFYRSAYEEQSSTLSSSKESIKRLEEEASKFADERRTWSVEKQSLIDKIKLYKSRASLGSPEVSAASAQPTSSSSNPQMERMLSVARAEVESQKSNNQVLQTAVKSLEEQIKSSDEKITKLTADLNAKNAELAAAKESLLNAEKKITEFESKGGLARSDADALREKIHELEEDLKQAKDEIALANSKAVEAAAALKEAKKEYTAEFIKRGKEAEQLVAAREERDEAIDEMKKEVEEMDKKLKEKDDAHAETKRQLSAAEEMVKQSERRIKALSEENDKYQTLFTSSGKEDVPSSPSPIPSSPNEVGKLKALLQQVNESKKLLIAREQEALLECSRHKARSLGLEKDLHRLEERLRQQEDHIERMRESEEKYSMLTAKVQELSMYESEYQRLKMELETQRQNLQKTQSELDVAKEENSKLKAQLNECTERFRHQNAALKTMTAKAERFEKLHAELTKKYANMEPAEVAKLREDEAKLKAELAQAQAQIKERSSKMESLQNASKALQVRVTELATQVRANETNMNSVKLEAEKKTKNLEEQLSMKIRLLNQEQGMRKLRDNRIKDLSDQMKKMEEQLKEEEKKVKAAADQQAKAQASSSSTQTVSTPKASASTGAVAHPAGSRVVRDKRNIELLQGSAKILQRNKSAMLEVDVKSMVVIGYDALIIQLVDFSSEEYRVQLSKALVALKKSGDGHSQQQQQTLAQKRKQPESVEPVDTSAPSAKITRIEQQQPQQQNEQDASTTQGAPPAANTTTSSPAEDTSQTPAQQQSSAAPTNEDNKAEEEPSSST